MDQVCPYSRVASVPAAGRGTSRVLLWHAVPGARQVAWAMLETSRSRSDSGHRGRGCSCRCVMWWRWPYVACGSTTCGVR